MEIFWSSCHYLTKSGVTVTDENDSYKSHSKVQVALPMASGLRCMVCNVKPCLA